MKSAKRKSKKTLSFLFNNGFRFRGAKNERSILVIAMRVDAFDEDVQKCIAGRMNVSLTKSLGLELRENTLEKTGAKQTYLMTLG